MGEACSTMGERNCLYCVWVEKREGKCHLEDAGVDGRIILRWIFKRWNEAWPGLIWFRIERGGTDL